MNITVLCVGKLKEKYWSDGCAEYVKRLGKYCTLQIDELRESNPAAEGAAILKRLKREDYVIALDIAGDTISSESFAGCIDSLKTSGKRAVFIIGGSDGLSDPVKGRADCRLSFSRLTYPHQMMLVILLEQLYRCFKIINNEKYHK